MATMELTLTETYKYLLIMDRKSDFLSLAFSEMRNFLLYHFRHPPPPLPSSSTQHLGTPQSEIGSAYTSANPRVAHPSPCLLFKNLKKIFEKNKCLC